MGRINRREMLAAGSLAGAPLLGGAGGKRITLVLDPADGVAASAPVQLAMSGLQAELSRVGYATVRAERPGRGTDVRVRSNGMKPAARNPALLTPQAARALVLAAIDQWVAAGAATLRARGDSSLELRFGSGEIWRLGENAITREK